MSATVAAGGDTRNLTWRKDTSTFAYRMMQKMGWSEGKGLGKNETGTASNIRMARRPEMLGLGAQTDEQGNSTLSKGLKDYDSILSQLAQQFGTPKTDKAKKKKKKHRHNYHKVLRAKDVSSYSSKDLSAILGVAVEQDIDVFALPSPSPTSGVDSVDSEPTGGSDTPAAAAADADGDAKAAKARRKEARRAKRLVEAAVAVLKASKRRAPAKKRSRESDDDATGAGAEDAAPVQQEPAKKAKKAKKVKKDKKSKKASKSKA